MSDHEPQKNKPWIIFNKYSPYMVVDCKVMKNSKGENVPLAPVSSLCRCGASGHKPYCDGTHSKIGFVGEKDPDRVPDRLKEYTGKDITIIDNRGVCSHSEECIKNLGSVFRKDRRPWIEPDAATVKDIVGTIEKCPSGALSYKIGEKHYKDLDREPAILVSKNGPLEVVGGIELKDDMGSKPESREHYTLCRCGASKNKPFCDGAHHEIGFRDDEN
ncbi:MAG: CDGSH iron-sulfur domain-containing protein [Candidatus Glassbacteria bacterium]